MRKIWFMLTGSLCLSLQILAQEVISGKVINAKDGTPVAGASISIKGGGSVISSTEGNFTIPAKKNEEMLIISSIGFFQSSVLSKVGTPVQIALKEDVRTLSEVVVTGVGIATSKRKLGISVESITAEKLPPAPTASIDQALVGKIPGAQISSINGTPGAPTSIVLRGINSIQGGTMPLILLDGIQVNTDINSLDLTSIERVEVIQGAAAGTIYGAQGANGVIQLFSKKGRKGRLSINLGSSYSHDEYINSGDFHKARLHTYFTDASNNVIDAAGNIVERDENGVYQGVRWANPAGSFSSAQANPNNIYNKPYNQNLKYYDHFAQLFAPGFTTNNNLNISGGSDFVDYSFSLANNHQTSTIRNNGYVDRTNFTSTLGINLFKGFKIRSNTQLVYTKNTLHPYYGFGNNNIFNVMNTAPFYDLNQTLADGTYPFYLGNDLATHTVNGYNPNFDFMYTEGKDTKVDIIQNFQANYTINRFIELDAKYGINHSRQDVNWLFKNQSGNANVNYESSWESYNNGSDATGEIDNFNYATTFQNLLISAYIKTDFQKDFNLKVPITTSTQLSYDYRNRRYSEYFTYGYSLPSYAIYNMQQTSTQTVTRDYVEPFITYGYLINQKVDFGEYGGVSAGLRSDYSSAFGGGSKPFTFPRGDAYFRLSSFNFWKNNLLGEVLPEFKIRAAYGEAGIQPRAFDRYRTLTPTNIGAALTFNLATAQRNPDLQVEVSKEFEIGTDIAFRGFKGNWFNSINLSGTYWTRKGESVIYNVSAPPSTGANTFLDNAISLSSKGVQASLNLNAYTSKNFTWNFTTNFSNQSSKIDNIVGGDIILTTSAGSTSLVLKAGEKIGTLYAYKALTSFDELRLNGQPYLAKEDYGKYEIVNGMLTDTATKAIQFTNDKYPLTAGYPKFNMSFINSFTYKNFLTFSFQFDWVYKNYIYNQTKEWMYRDGIHGDFDIPVTINGTTAAYSAYYRSAYAAYFGDLNGAARNGTKDYFYEDASFLRLRNIALAFDIANVVNIKYFRKLQLVLTGRNIWTITKYSGFDPEINSAGSSTPGSSASYANSAWDRGIDHNSMPNVKSYQVGLNVGF